MTHAYLKTDGRDLSAVELKERSDVLSGLRGAVRQLPSDNPFYDKTDSYVLEHSSLRA